MTRRKSNPAKSPEQLPRCALAIEKLSLSNFRNYRRLRLEVGPAAGNVFVLCGPNGVGKTNFLEALSYLVPGRGMRGARLAEVNSGQQAGMPWAVAARLRTPGGAFEIGTGLTPAPRPEKGRVPAEADPQTASAPAGNPAAGVRRVVRIDGEPASGPAALGVIVSAAWLTPGMDRIFKEGPGGRRRFLDRMVLGLHPEHGKRLNTYERAQRERLRLLADRNRKPDPDWLSALERRLAETGVAIAAARLDTLSHLQTQIDDGAEGSFPKADLALDGVLENRLLERPAIEVEDAFAARLAEDRALDREIGRQSAGPHRSDLVARHRMKDIPAALCSTGEQKALLINMVLADARMQAQIRGQGPILLLDEVAAHLDKRRRGALFDELLGLDSQIWLTGTDSRLFEPLVGLAAFYGVENDEILPLEPDRPAWRGGQ